jgi:hypothetical protein
VAQPFNAGVMIRQSLYFRDPIYEFTPRIARAVKL